MDAEIAPGGSPLMFESGSPAESPGGSQALSECGSPVVSEGTSPVVSAGDSPAESANGSSVMSAAKAVSDETEQIRIRKAKRQKLIEQGLSPFALRVGDYVPIGEIRDNSDYGGLEPGEETSDTVATVGRMVFKREAGRLCFAMLQDGEGRKLQIMLSEAEVGADSLDQFKSMADLGDFISARGRVISSKTGELSVLAETWAIVSKALRPLPVLHKELSNEASSRRRYLDFITDPESAELMKIRSQVINSLRENYFRRGYIELETPIIQTIHGGAAAKPFQTRIHAFDLDVFLRISPELFLKRAVVGGLERVFEINRVFRNEGVDSTHSPEFTMLESYQAYADYNDVAQLTQNLIQRCAEDVFGTTELKLRDGEIFDLGGTWQTRDFYATLSEAIGEEISPQTPVDALRKIAQRVGLEKDVLSHDQPGLVSHGKLAELLFEHFWLEKFQQPTFIRDFPLDTSPLVSSSPDNPAVVEKWDLYIRGMELATGYSELTDPVVQRERLIQQSKLAAAGDEEAMSIDEEFLEALEHGMPPTGGLGLGIDRLLMALTGVTSIRETIPFPLVKPIGRV